MFTQPYRWRMLAGGSATCALAFLLVAAVPHAGPRPGPVVRRPPPVRAAPGNHLGVHSLHVGNKTYAVPGNHLGVHSLHVGNKTYAVPAAQGRGGVQAQASGSVAAQRGKGVTVRGQASANAGKMGQNMSSQASPNRNQPGVLFFPQFAAEGGRMMMPMGGAPATMGFGSAMPGYPYGAPMASYYGGAGYGGAAMGNNASAGGGGNGMGGAPRTRVAGAGDEREDEAENVSRVLTAAGVPTVEGQVAWPVGLRALGAPEARELVQQICAELEQAAEGSSGAGRAVTDDVAALRRLLQRDKDERFSLPAQAYEDAEAFLTRLDRAGKQLAETAEPQSR
ncbi:MAG TPA: hypothetical protein VFW33_05895, partial [Gemmataceae bacterium]|nr:hypothetical protein [Gemmataceae bacterium]